MYPRRGHGMMGRSENSYNEVTPSPEECSRSCVHPGSAGPLPAGRVISGPTSAALGAVEPNGYVSYWTSIYTPFVCDVRTGDIFLHSARNRNLCGDSVSGYLGANQSCRHLGGLRFLHLANSLGKHNQAFLTKSR